MQGLKASFGIILLVGLGSAHASLLGRTITGQAVAANDASAAFEYDTDLDITWLRDWNYAQTSGYVFDGKMNWAQANTWATNLTVGTFSGWKLPTSDANCNGGSFLGPGFGYNCTGSQMGHLWYSELLNPAGSMTDTGPFQNLLSDYYWSGTAYAPYPGAVAWFFNTEVGYQGNNVAYAGLYAVAVRSGDVAAGVPEPQTWALALTAFVTATMLRRRRTSRL